jgi:hypothetical protein
MDLLSLAEERFRQLAPALALPMTVETSVAVEGWARDHVCPVAEQLLGRPVFQGWARWSPDRLGPGSASEQRPLVEAVDRALVEAAGRILAAARGLGLPTAPGRACSPAPPAVPPPASLDALEWLAKRPWFDLACPEEYFTVERGLHLIKPPPAGCSRPCDLEELRAPLGDYVGRAMFARIGYLSRIADEAFRSCLAHGLPDGEGKGAAFAGKGRMFAAKSELDRAIVSLRRACYKGNESRLRDACATLVQVYAAYGPDPDEALRWLGCPNSWPSVSGAIIRGIVRPPGELVRVEIDGQGVSRVVAFEKARLCRPDVAQGIAQSLAIVAELYRRPTEADQLIQWLRRERRLLLVDRRPRNAYWDGEPVGPDWDRNAVLWDLVWKLALRARHHQPAHSEDLTSPGRGSVAVKNRRSRLSKSIPPEMDVLIEDVRPGGYRLVLEPDQIGLLQLDHDEQLIEAGLEIGPTLL